MWFEHVIRLWIAWKLKTLQIWILIADTLNLTLFRFSSGCLCPLLFTSLFLSHFPYSLSLSFSLNSSFSVSLVILSLTLFPTFLTISFSVSRPVSYASLCKNRTIKCSFVSVRKCWFRFCLQFWRPLSVFTCSFSLICFAWLCIDSDDGGGGDNGSQRTKK